MVTPVPAWSAPVDAQPSDNGGAVDDRGALASGDRGAAAGGDRSGGSGRIDRDPDSALRDLDSGDERTCALDLRYIAYCWGNDGTGRLGAGDFLAHLAVTSGFEAFCMAGTATGTGCDLTGLINGKQYDVTVFAYATDGTKLSEFATATPGVKAGPADLASC